MSKKKNFIVEFENERTVSIVPDEDSTSKFRRYRAKHMFVAGDGSLCFTNDPLDGDLISFVAIVRAGDWESAHAENATEYLKCDT